MVLIYLNEKNQEGYDSSGTIIKGNYDECDLFEKYDHKLNKPTNVNYIELYERRTYLTYGNYDLRVTIDGGYEKQKLIREEVYFNRYKGDFLILVLYFESLKAKYFTKSEYNRYKSASPNIGQLTDFDQDQLLNVLIKENDSTNDTLTYQIDKIETGYSDRIEFKTEPNYQSTGFTKNIHKPKNGQKPSFILYKKQLLNTLNYGRVEPIASIQNQTYTSVEVLFSNKIDEPLLVCLVTSTDRRECYQHKTLNNINYFEKIGDGYDELIKDDNDKLIKKLQTTEFDLVKTILIPVEYKYEYSSDDIQTHTGKSPRDSQPEKIVVSEKNDLSNKLKDLNYKCFHHSIDVGTGVKEKAFRLILYLAKNQIILNDENGQNEDIYYDKGNKIFCTYFYDQDPRPLLICYKSNAYKPASLKEYPNKWLKVDAITTCGCNSKESMDQVLQALHEASLELNPVRLKTFSEQTIKTFKDTQIKIRCSYRDLKCYRKYSHQPAENGFRLGKLTYNNKGPDTIRLTYNKDKVLSKAITYYHAYDNNHRHPLLVELEFKGQGTTNEKKYFKLKKKDRGEEQWELTNIDPKNDDEIEEEIYDIRLKLGIDFEDKTQKLFEPSKCGEFGLPVWLQAVCGVVPTAGIGGGIAAYFFRGAIATCWKSTF